MNKPITISFEDACVDYGSGTLALNHVSAQLSGGRIVALLGANGAGKSTFIHACAGVRPLTAGTVASSHSYIGWCAQHLMIDWFVSIETNVWMGARLAGLTGDAAWERARACLAQVGLDSVNLQMTPEALSGGQQQRLMIARVLAMNAPIMLMDEPTVGLDLTNIARLRQVLLEAKDRGALVVVSSHDFSAIESMIDDVLFLSAGKLLFQGSKEEFVRNYVTAESVALELDRELSDDELASLATTLAIPAIARDEATDHAIVLTLELGRALGDVLRAVESQGLTVRDVTRRGVDLEQAFTQAVNTVEEA